MNQREGQQTADFKVEVIPQSCSHTTIVHFEGSSERGYMYISPEWYIFKKRNQNKHKLNGKNKVSYLLSSEPGFYIHQGPQRFQTSADSKQDV